MRKLLSKQLLHDMYVLFVKLQCLDIPITYRIHCWQVSVTVLLLVSRRAVGDDDVVC